MTEHRASRPADPHRRDAATTPVDPDNPPFSPVELELLRLLAAHGATSATSRAVTTPGVHHVSPTESS